MPEQSPHGENPPAPTEHAPPEPPEPSEQTLTPDEPTPAEKAPPQPKDTATQPLSPWDELLWRPPGNTTPTPTTPGPDIGSDPASAPGTGGGSGSASGGGSDSGSGSGIGSATASGGDSDTASGAGSGSGGRGPLSSRTGLAQYPMHPPRPVAPPRWRRVSCPAGVLPAAGVAGVVAALAVPVDRPGIGWLLAGSASAGAVIVVDRRARGAAGVVTGRGWERIWWTGAALALLAVGAVRAAEWLFVLCVVAAGVAGSLAVVGRRSVHGVLYDAIAVPLSSFGALAWVYTALGRAREGVGTRHRRLGVSAAATVALLLVFVPLLGSADATFGALVVGLLPDLDGGSVARWLVVFAVAGVATVSAMYLLAGPPPPAEGRQGISRRTLSRTEWGLPVGALTIVFAAFVAAQLVALFGGDGYVQRTAGLTYAEYARSGFWQLSAVTVLTLAVILSVLHWAAKDSAADRRWLRVLLAAISGLTLVILASALGRMWTYQQAYGFTVLRLLVETCELWLGVVYVLVVVAIVRLELTWLPRAAVGTAMAALLVLAALNPEALIADRNIDRWQHGKALDTDYLAELSLDVLPATDRLPDPLRTDLRDRLRHRAGDDPWNGWNLSRAHAR